MLNEICLYIRNFFEKDKYFGSFKIENGNLTYFNGNELPLLDGQYFRIIGSTFNDNVFSNPPFVNGQPLLRDETFEGAVWALAIPKEVLEIADEIENWKTIYGGADSPVNAPYSSESFDGYSYSKASGGGTDGTSGASAGDWKSVYGSRLNLWRKI